MGCRLCKNYRNSELNILQIFTYFTDIYYIHGYLIYIRGYLLYIHGYYIYLLYIHIPSCNYIPTNDWKSLLCVCRDLIMAHSKTTRNSPLKNPGPATVTDPLHCTQFVHTWGHAIFTARETDTRLMSRS